VNPAELSYLAQAARDGDDRALRELVSATESQVIRLCAHLGSREDARDLAQETYLRALRALPTYRAEAPVVAWLFGIARHVCADHVRRRVRRGQIEAAIPSRPKVVDPGAGADIGDLVARLDEDQRAAFVLTQVFGLAYEEAAIVCGCPVGTIRSRVARARGRLVEWLEAAEAV
jgi:RNA polymerase sigma-70 factor (ECF subfamily)